MMGNNIYYLLLSSKSVSCIKSDGCSRLVTHSEDQPCPITLDTYINL
jgi:hypothetical protein